MRSTSWFAAFGVVLLCADAAWAQARPGLQSGDLHNLRSVEDVQLSPDGRTIAYVVSNRERPGRPYSQIWLMNVATRASTRLGTEAETGSSPRWSPDGRWIAYSGSDGQRSGIVIRRPDGTGLRVIAEVQGSNHPVPGTGERLSWAPDSKRIAYISATAGPEPAEATASGNPIVITRYLYRTTGADGSSYFSDNRRLHVFTVDVESGATRQLTDGIYNEHSVDWSPAGDEIMFVSNREPDADRFFAHDIFAVSANDGRVRRITSLEAVVYRPRWSPDGRMIAFQGTRRGLTSSETTMEDTRVWVMNADGTGRRELARELDNRHGAPEWSRDGRQVLFTVQERGSVRLYQVALLPGSKPSVVIGETGRIGGFVSGPRGEIAYTFHSAEDLPQLYLRNGSSAQRLTELNRDLLSARAVAPIDSFTFVAFDGLEVNAFLTLPHGRTEGSKHPLVVMIKGGPHGQQGPVFDARAQAFSTAGYATLMVNYRGSTGYGQKFTDAIFADQNGREAMDVLQGTDAAVRRFTWLDRNRIGVEGGSYGGQLSMWLVTQTDRYAAAIPRAGIANLVSHNYLSYYHDYLAVEFGGFPHQNGIMDKLWERSPIRYVAQVKTPVMLVHGLNDHNVPRTESEQFYIALKDVGVETALVLYPRAGHGLSETAQIVDFTERSIAWYRKHFERRGRAVMN